MNRQHILSRLGQRHSILYSNGPWTIWDRHGSEFRSAPLFGAFRQRDNVHVDHSPRILLSHPSRSRWEGAVRNLSAARWRRRLGSLPGNGLIAYVSHPQYVDYAFAVRPDVVVYSPYDLFAATPGWTQDQENQEDRLLRACDVVITVSDPIKSRLQVRTTAPTFCIPNGADAAAFAIGSTRAAPDDIAAIPRPRIGYVGCLNRKVDFDLIERLALLNPAWHFIFVGPSFGHDRQSCSAMERCQRMPNVHFLGMKPTSSLPPYVGALDVGLMCYRQGTWAKYASSPLKLHEYLAAGLPIVSSSLPLLPDSEDFVQIAEDDTDWCVAIADALKRNSPDERAARQRAARQNTWDIRVTQIEEIVTEAYLRKRGVDALVGKGGSDAGR